MAHTSNFNVLFAGHGLKMLPIMQALNRTLQAPDETRPVAENSSTMIGTIYAASPVRNDPCQLLADEALAMDYRQTTVLKQIFKYYDMHAVVPGCQDHAYLAASPLAKEHGLSGYDEPETTQNLFNKAKFRQLCQHLNIPQPNFSLAENNPQLKLPILIKPIPRYSNFGIIRVDHTEALPTILHWAKEEKEGIICEELIQGSIHSCSLFIEDKNIIHNFFVDEFCNLTPFAVNDACYPSMLRHELRQKILDCMMNLITSCQLADGLLHCQFIVQGDEFFVIDITRRCPGDLYGHLIELATGFPYFTAYIAPFIGKKISDLVTPKMANAPRNIARHAVFSPHTALSAMFSFEHDIPAIWSETISVHAPGEQLPPPPHGRLALLFLELIDKTTLWRFMPKLSEHIRVHALTQRLKTR